MLKRVFVIILAALTKNPAASLHHPAPKTTGWVARHTQPTWNPHLNTLTALLAQQPNSDQVIDRFIEAYPDMKWADLEAMSKRADSRTKGLVGVMKWRLLDKQWYPFNSRQYQQQIAASLKKDSKK